MCYDHFSYRHSVLWGLAVCLSFSGSSNLPHVRSTRNWCDNTSHAAPASALHDDGEEPPLKTTLPCPPCTVATQSTSSRLVSSDICFCARLGRYTVSNRLSGLVFISPFVRDRVSSDSSVIFYIMTRLAAQYATGA